jgi:hypothetical protein
MNIGETKLFLTSDSLITIFVVFFVVIALLIRQIVFSYKSYSEKKKMKFIFAATIGFIFTFFPYRYAHSIFMNIFFIITILVIIYFIFLLFTVNSKYQIEFSMPRIKRIRKDYLSFIIILFVLPVLDKI